MLKRTERNFPPKKKETAVEQTALPQQNAAAVDESDQEFNKQTVTQSNEETVVLQVSSSALTASANATAPGGIDLNPRLLKMNVTGDSASLAVFPAPEFLLDPSMLNAMPSDRFVPLIIEVVPVATIDMFLGMSNVETDDQLASAIE